MLYPDPAKRNDHSYFLVYYYYCDVGKPDVLIFKKVNANPPNSPQEYNRLALIYELKQELEQRQRAILEAACAKAQDAEGQEQEEKEEEKVEEREEDVWQWERNGY